MKRYMPAIRLGSEANDDCAEMVEVRTGDYIRHDDPDLAALVAAAIAVDKAWIDMVHEDDLIDPMYALRTAIAAVAGTTRGRE